MSEHLSESQQLEEYGGAGVYRQLLKRDEKLLNAQKEYTEALERIINETLSKLSATDEITYRMARAEARREYINKLKNTSL